MVVLWDPGEELGSLCWGIRLSQSEPFHIIGQGHLLSSRSGEAFPTNATQLARSSTLCFTTPLYTTVISRFSSLLLLLLFFYNSPVFSVLSIQYKSLLNLNFLSSSALSLPVRLSILSVICSYWLCIAEVCFMPLYITLLCWRNSSCHNIHLSWILMNLCVCVCVCHVIQNRTDEIRILAT